MKFGTVAALAVGMVIFLQDAHTTQYKIQSAVAARLAAERNPRIRVFAKCIEERSHGAGRVVIAPAPEAFDVYWLVDIHIEDSWNEWDLEREPHYVNRRTGVLERRVRSETVPVSSEPARAYADDGFTWWKRLGCRF